MQTYIALIQFTEEGLQTIDSSPSRADHFKHAMEKKGIEVVSSYWTTGSRDGVLYFRAPDDVAASASMLQLARDGHVRTELLRAYGRREFEELLKQSK